MIKSIKKKILCRLRARRIKNLCIKKNNWLCCCDSSDDGALKLSKAKEGFYEFLCAKCDEHLVHRLLEMGFVPGDNIKVLSHMGSRGSVMIEVKGSKLALSNKIADNILVAGKKII
ncbi:MAG: ferrous iron transport protein A [Endomicrobium sp.]|jgi:Fe2+ transport system protein FeoA|nr:ferrous iron transport protein A [Endomicrobium sp.]